MNGSPEFIGLAEESIGRRTFVTGVTIAAVSSAITLFVRNVLPAADGNKAEVIHLQRETNKSWLNTQDRMFTDRQKPLAAGDEGLLIREGKEQISFAYDFNLHPLKEFPGIHHVERFRQFIESWMIEHGMNERWITFPIDVQQGVEPDERCIVPQSMYWYHMKCTAMPKPMRIRGGMMA